MAQALTGGRHFACRQRSAAQHPPETTLPSAPSHPTLPRPMACASIATTAMPCAADPTPAALRSPQGRQCWAPSRQQPHRGSARACRRRAAAPPAAAYVPRPQAAPGGATPDLDALLQQRLAGAAQQLQGGPQQQLQLPAVQLPAVQLPAVQLPADIDAQQAADTAAQVRRRRFSVSAMCCQAPQRCLPCPWVPCCPA